jgi:hypothetical protein
MKSVETVLLENINNPNSLFIFPTDIAASRWADHLLRLKGGITGSASVAMNKFIAWDEFKQESIKSKVKNKRSIPSALRKIFACRLVNENAQAVKDGKEPVFTSLIKTQWAPQTSQFAPWLANILPQLGSLLNNKSISAQSEGDFLDMFTLTQRYGQFLDEHNLFEPAWETPPFNNDGRECFIFFPESLNDYAEYRQLLAGSGHVKIISGTSTDSLLCDTFFYTNARREITEAALYIRALHENDKIAWDSIAVCIPDSENYEPYVTREFKNRNIPFVKRTSRALTDYPAGSFFPAILECVSQDFSFSSLVSLIMNKNLPWKETTKINNLIDFGITNNCLHSWTETQDGKERHINVWEDAFKKPHKGFDKETKEFFDNLKSRLIDLRRSPSFSQLLKEYFIFREQFLDMENCCEETDLVISRCISELMALAELEKDFPDVKAVDPFQFLIEYLGEKYYLPQPKTGGVAILPYKAAAAAPFDCHIILGAGQENLSVLYTKLDFLPLKKREELGIFDEDASSCFINLHKYNSVKKSAFFCSEQTFSGFSIPHAKINAPAEPKERCLEFPDYYALEKDFKADKLHDIQSDGFKKWKNRRASVISGKKSNSAGELQNYIKAKYGETGKYSVSASSLKSYFECSLKWLFDRVFSIENVPVETSLMAENISGLVYHAVLSNFFNEIKKKNEKLPEPVRNEQGNLLPQPCRRLLENSINEVFSGFPYLKPDDRTKMSAITTRLLRAGKKDFQYHLENCLVNFLSYFAGCSIFATEIYYQIDRDSYILNGFVDCILKEPSQDKYIIVDFKLKNMPRRSECTGEEDDLSDFQLPMYITLTEEKEKVKVYTALFYSIIDAKSEVLTGSVQDENTGNVIPKKEEDRIIRDSEKYNGIFERFNKKTQQFAREISTGNLSVFETDNKNCYGCEYHRICRTVYIIDCKKNISLGND